MSKQRNEKLLLCTECGQPSDTKYAICKSCVKEWTRRQDDPAYCNGCGEKLDNCKQFPDCASIRQSEKMAQFENKPKEAEKDIELLKDALSEIYLHGIDKPMTWCGEEADWWRGITFDCMRIAGNALKKLENSNG
jgi:hypothetical protein